MIRSDIRATVPDAVAPALRIDCPKSMSAKSFTRARTKRWAGRRAGLFTKTPTPTIALVARASGLIASGARSTIGRPRASTTGAASRKAGTGKPGAPKKAASNGTGCPSCPSRPNGTFAHKKCKEDLQKMAPEGSSLTASH
jgi:hypothetical protein